jgi:hypothetical protein
LSRTEAERIADVRRLLAAARHIHDHRAELVPQIVASTGLSPEGVELGFESLERDATDAELGELVAAAGTARHVHIVLSANVFVAALRALALARAAAPRVTIRPSARDPVLARALVDAAGDPAMSLADERDASSSGADAVHVYGRDETIDQVRAQVGPEVRVLAHGAGLGIALVTAGADVGLTARALARDVAAFDQRGCLSPRVAFLEGDADRARAFALALHEGLAELDTRVPRGTLSPQERIDAVRWCDSLAFAGELWTGIGHAVGLAADSPALAVPPSGRHLLLVAVADLGHARRAIAPLAARVVSVGSDDLARAATVAPSHARTAELGRMQRPPLDGPVDRRTAGRAGAVT